MKKLTALFLILSVCIGAFASVKPIVAFNPAARYSTFEQYGVPQSHKIKDTDLSSWMETSQDIYYRYFDQIGLADLGFKIDDENFAVVMDIDLRQTFSSFCKSNYYSNIPFLGNTVNAILDFNFPRIAYGEAEFGKFYFSLGRRPINWGPAIHNMAISSDVPFLDNFWAEYNTDLGKGKFGYNFVVVSLNSEALDKKVQKTLLGHKLSWANDCLRFNLGELNLVYGSFPNLLDLSPFGIYHNLFQDSKSNVMLYLSAEYLADLADLGKIRFYGTFAMDDFDLPDEKAKNNGKPGANGVNFGIQYHVFDGEKTETFDNSTKKYALSDDSFTFDNGLNISYEFAFCSPYMYNRSVEAGKFTVPVKMYGSPSTHDADAMFIGFKYGPNSMYNEISVDYSTETLSAKAGVGLLTRGSDYSILSPYGEDAVANGTVNYDYCYKLYGDKCSSVIINAQCKWLYRTNMELFADINFVRDLYNKKSAVEATLGTSISLF